MFADVVYPLDEVTTEFEGPPTVGAPDDSLIRAIYVLPRGVGVTWSSSGRKWVYESSDAKTKAATVLAGVIYPLDEVMTEIEDPLQNIHHVVSLDHVGLLLWAQRPFEKRGKKIPLTLRRRSPFFSPLSVGLRESCVRSPRLRGFVCWYVRRMARSLNGCIKKSTK